jgi:diphthine synthase
MLTFVGLGLYDEDSVTLRGQNAIRAADTVFAECYTSVLAGTTLERLESAHDVTIEVRNRAGVEENPEPILAAAERDSTVFLTGGDPMVSTTHVDLRLRAADRDIETRIVHGTTAQTAASSLTGLQNYRFGKATTLPFPEVHPTDGLPQSVLDVVSENRKRNLHTLVYLDIDPDADRYLHGPAAAERLADRHRADALGVIVARAGSADPTVRADRLDRLATADVGPPLHLLVLPADLHDLEAEALETLADAPADLIDSTWSGA